MDRTASTLSRHNDGWKVSYEAQELLDVPCVACGSRACRDVAREFGIALARCDHCGQVYTRTPLPDSQSHYVIPSTEAIEAKYDPILRGEAAHPRDDNYVEHLRTIEGVCGPGNLLDVGSHSGFFLRIARGRGWKVTGVEPSPTTSALARDRFGLDVFTGTLNEVALPESSFDVATLVDVFEHIGQPLALLGDVYRVLRPGGVLFIKVPNVRYVLAKYQLATRFKVPLDDILDAREHLGYYSNETLVAILRAAGFEVIGLRVPTPIQTGSALRRSVRALGPAIARRTPRGVATPLATDLAALARRP